MSIRLGLLLLVAVCGCGCSLGAPEVKWDGVVAAAGNELFDAAERWAERGSRAPAVEREVVRWGRWSLTSTWRVRRVGGEGGSSGGSGSGLRMGVRGRVDRELVYLELRFRW